MAAKKRQHEKKPAKAAAAPAHEKKPAKAAAAAAPAAAASRGAPYGVLAAAVVAVVVGLAALDPGYTTAPLAGSQAARTALSARINETLAHASVHEVSFESQGVACHGWFFAPKVRGGGAATPVVVMGHGFAGQKDQGLAKYADVFAGRGIASLAIDYRTFGGSGGAPRHVVDPPGHAQDLVAAALHVLRGGDAAVAAAGVTPRSKLGVWGSSMGGGHALVAAAALGDLASAVVSQMPMLDGFANSKFNIVTKGLLASLRLAAVSLHDMARGALGLEPARVAAYAALGDLGVMNLPDSELASYYAKHPSDGHYLGDWENKVCARTLLKIKDYRPLLLVPAIKAPVCFLRPGNDIVLPNDIVLEAKALARHPKSILHQFDADVGHFHVYREAFPEAARVQADFLVDALLSAS